MTAPTTSQATAQRADLVDHAWDRLMDRDASNDDVRSACQTIIDNCTDTRRDTAYDILAVTP